MSPTATTRDMFGDVRPADIALVDAEKVIIEVPGFGHAAFSLGMVGAPVPADEVAGEAPAEGTEIYAYLIQRDLESGNPVFKPRECRRTDAGLELEILPNSSGEDRVVVCVAGWPA